MSTARITRRSLVAATAATVAVTAPVLAIEPVDPLVALERRHGEIFAVIEELEQRADSDPDADLDQLQEQIEAGDDATWAIIAEIAETPISSIAGVGVMARLLLNSTKTGPRDADENCVAAILKWVGEQTGRDEFVGGMNFEKVRVG